MSTSVLIGAAGVLAAIFIIGFLARRRSGRGKADQPKDIYPMW